jgi:D-inositol-3-phosphate glycosyltransferase
MIGNVHENDICTPSSGRLQCMLMRSTPPGGQLGSVRARPQGFLGRLLRYEQQIATKMHPEIRNTSHVRGVEVATDYLLQAFLQQSQCADFTLVVPNRRKETFEQWAAAYPSLDGRSPVRICTATQLLGLGASASVPDIWLDLHGAGHLAFRLRNHISSRMFPTVSVQHGLSEHTLLYQHYLRTLLTPHFACDSLVCTSSACRRAFAQVLDSVASSFNREYGTDLKFKGRLDVIPLCVDTDQLRPRDKQALRKQLRIPTSTFLLLYVGYLSQIKADLTPLLTTIRRLIGANPGVDLRLIVAGTGPEEYSKELLSLTRELGLTKRVFVMRDVSDNQKEKLLGAADVFLGPCQSMQESFGLTPIEAMACGLPQVVADWNGYRDTVVNEETGFLIPTTWGRCDSDLCCTGDLLGWPFDHIVQGQSIAMDLDYMYEHLNILINHPELLTTMSERSRARAVAHFSYANVARLYDELWIELAAIAQTAGRPQHTRRFDQPAYFENFGHFATRELNDGSLIGIGNSDAISIGRLVQLYHSELPGISMLDEKLLTDLGEILTTVETSSETMSVGQLISQKSNNIWSSETVRRHILFLLKHGRLTVT